MNKPLAVTITFLVVLTTSMAWVISSPKQASNPNNPSAQSNSGSSRQSTKGNTNTAPAGESFTKQEVSKHKSRSDCWTIIENNVYDVTKFIAQHPGGDNILSACGVDATDYFNGGKAGQQGDKNDHSSTARTILSEYLIGTLSN